MVSDLIASGSINFKISSDSILKIVIELIQICNMSKLKLIYKIHG